MFQTEENGQSWIGWGRTLNKWPQTNNNSIKDVVSFRLESFLKFVMMRGALQRGRYGPVSENDTVPCLSSSYRTFRLPTRLQFTRCVAPWFEVIKRHTDCTTGYQPSMIWEQIFGSVTLRLRFFYKRLEIALPLFQLGQSGSVKWTEELWIKTENWWCRRD